MTHVDSHRNRLRRLRLLQFLSRAYPERLSDQVLLSMAQQDPQLTPDLFKVRRSLHYLQDRGFIAIETKTTEVWMARCLPDGIDYLEGPDPGIEGLAHPDNLLQGVTT